MNLEINRLKSFDSCEWLRRISISAIRFANAGLFYVGAGDSVRCFSCNDILKLWKHGQSPKKRHKLSFPSCGFVNGNDVLNIPLVVFNNSKCSPNLPTVAGESSRYETNVYSEVRLNDSTDDLKKINVNIRSLYRPIQRGTTDYTMESNRLKSFATWPLSSPVDSYDLAVAGFYQTADKTVKCFACLGEISKWKLGDKPSIRHSKLFPSCPFVHKLQRQINTTRTFKHNGRVIAGTGKISLKENTKYPEFAHETTRFGSFVNWPENHLKRSLNLAKAGFFATKSEYQGDLVTCFCCGIRLDQWKPNDEPWKEHARWSPGCSWLLEMKGELFVKEYGDKNNTTDLRLSYPSSHKMKTERIIENTKSNAPTQETCPWRYPDIMKPVPSRLDASNEKLHSRIKLNDYCQVCFHTNSEVAFLPCQHLSACEECSRGLMKCPACSSHVDEVVRLFHK